VATTNFYSGDASLVHVSGAMRAIPGLSLKALATAPSKAVYPKFALSRNGKYLIQVQRQTVQAWNMETAQPISRAIDLAESEHPISGCISENGKRALVYARGAAEMYDLTSGKRMHSPFKTGSSITSATFSPDGRYVAIHGGTLAQAWEVETGRAVFASVKQRGRLRYADFSPDSRMLVVCATNDGLEKHAAQIWFPGTGKQLTNRLDHGDGILMAGFSPDSQWLVTASEDFYATVWEAATGKPMPPSIRHEHQALFANYSRNGRWIVTASANAQVRLWDAASRKPLTPPLTLPTRELSSVRFVEGDNAVFITSEDGRAWLWRLSTERRTVEELRWFCELVCGGGDFETRRFNIASPARLKEGWEKFRKENPEDFRASPAEIWAWHQHEMEQARANGQTNAVEFHRNILNPAGGRIEGNWRAGW